MKRLKPNTVKKYTNQQLLNHMNRLLDLFETPAPYRIDTYVREYYETERAYLPAFSLSNREAIIEAIERLYKEKEIVWKNKLKKH